MTPTIVERPLWATHVFEICNPEHEELGKALVDLCKQLAARMKDDVPSGVGRESKLRLIESQWNFLAAHQHREVERLRMFCEEAILQVLGRLAKRYPVSERGAEGAFRVIMKESWFHVTKDGGAHDFHAHPNCSWSGIYYVQKADSFLLPDGRNGVNRFYSPLNLNYRDAGTDYFYDTFDVVPEDGKLVIFPSYLGHSAIPYHGKQERVVIAFNAIVHRDG